MRICEARDELKARELVAHELPVGGDELDLQRRELLVAEQEERPVREQAAVRLVLGLPERQVAVPQVERAGQEPQRIGRQVQFGVG